ncbi:MAG: thioredoxin-disulfide reductase [Alphaproteobacteria bacterium GM7ARS4]|nr:thioredoxin-disulfide reductase [Alphaproteobacteria bacterium GM7ARS4]
MADTTKKEKTRLLIIGTGPAGCTAAIYAARANLAPLLVSGLAPGGQLTITTDVENYPGFVDAVQGPDLMESMQRQASRMGARLMRESIVRLDVSQNPMTAWCDGGGLIEADAIIIATGAKARWLGLPSEAYYKGYGVSACATCDGFFYRGKHVVVIGGGNTAVEEALYLTRHASHVTLMHRRHRLRAEQCLQDRLRAYESRGKVTIMWDHVLREVYGTKDPRAVQGIVVEHSKNGTTRRLDVEGVFVAIGHDPATEIFRTLLECDEDGYIKVAPGSTQTSVAGVFAAGDVCDKIYRQAVTAAGMGCMAALDVERFLTSTS